MKRFISLALVLCLLLCACGNKNEEVPTTEAQPAETNVPTEISTEAPTDTPTEAATEPETVVYRNPLTGEILDEPITTRIFALSVGNTSDAIPHYGLSEADIVWEIYVNDYATRLLAMYADINSVESVGSIRSQRYPFTDMAQAYDAIACSAGGSSVVLSDVSASGVDYMNIDTSSSTSYSYRDQDRINSGYAGYHSLFAIGTGLVDHAVKKGIDVTQDPDKTYGLNFEENVQLQGESAEKITFSLRLSSAVKKTTMVYNESLGKYEFNEYGKQIVDGYYMEAIVSFKNVIGLYIPTKTDSDGYHVANSVGSGTGYLACNGQIVEICWSRDGDNAPFVFTYADGSPVTLDVGSSYIAFMPEKSTVSWE